jgi:hypothetical protein
MTIALDAVAGWTLAEDQPGVNSATWSHTCTGSNLDLFVGVTVRGNIDKVSGVTYNGVSLTQVWTVSADGNYHSSGWILVNPGTGAHDIVVTFSTTTVQWNGPQAACSMSFTGVHQTTPTNTPGTATGYSTNASVTVATAADEMIVDAVRAGENVTVGANQTQRYGAGTRNGYSTQAGSDGGVMSWSMSSHWWGIGAVSLKPAAGGQLTKNLDETLTLSDAVVRGFGMSRADSLTLSDAIVKSFGMSRSDTITLSDAIAKLISTTKADTITLSDSFNAIITLILALSDTITLSDARTRAIGLSKADSITLSDAIAKAVAFTRADTITLSDSINVIKALILSLSDSITLSDAATKSPRLSETDMITLSDVISKAYQLHEADVITLTEMFYKSAGAMGVSLDDTITLSDFISMVMLALELGETTRARRFTDTAPARRFTDVAPRRYS